MDGAWTQGAPRRLGEGSHPQRPPGCLLAGYGYSRRTGPAGRRREQADLVDRLRRAHMMELRRTVGRTDDERHPGLVSLDHSRVQLSGGRTTGRADDGGDARCQGEADGVEGGAALIELHVEPHRGVGGQRHGQGRRSGTGANDGVGDAGAHPLIHQRCRKSGLYAHERCRSTSKCAGPAHRWSCCTDSPRPPVCGAPSPTSWRRSSR